MANINFKNLIRQLVPFHKLQINRLVWLASLLYPLQELFNILVQYRKEVRRITRVTSQIKVFEGYLQTKYNETVNIKLVTFSDGALNICLEDEGILSMDIPLSNENKEGISIPLRLEVREQFGDVDLIVYIPMTLEIDNIRADIERFKQALITYQIIQR